MFFRKNSTLRAAASVRGVDLQARRREISRRRVLIRHGADVASNAEKFLYHDETAARFARRFSNGSGRPMVVRGSQLNGVSHQSSTLQNRRHAHAAGRADANQTAFRI